MGSPFQLIFYARDLTKAQELANSSFLLIDSLNAVCSDYADESELNRLSRTAGSGRPMKVSPQLYEVLLQSKTAAEKSKGSFDVTIGVLSRLWRQARKEKVFPASETVLAAKQKTGMQHLLIDTLNRTVLLSQPNLQLDLGGIAKGWIAQQVISFLFQQGVTSALADAGGDIACSQPPPGKKGWTVGINLPESTTELLPQTITISNSAIATSGDLYQYLEHDGVRYSHIIDPRTGYGVPFQRNVTVLAPDGATADWLATACSILPIRQCKKLVRQYGAELLITQWKKKELEYYLSKGMKTKLKK